MPWTMHDFSSAQRPSYEFSPDYFALSGTRASLPKIAIAPGALRLGAIFAL
jgi:hypothetical protein